MAAVSHYLLVISERNALAWVLEHRRMAFPAHRSRDAERLRVGDRLLLYTTQGCFHNPTRDRGRVVGIGSIASEATSLEEPVQIAGRAFSSSCELTVDSLATFGAGVELAPLVPHPEAFPDPRSWSARMRRPLVQLSASDAALLTRELKPSLAPPDQTLPSYPAVSR